MRLVKVSRRTRGKFLTQTSFKIWIGFLKLLVTILSFGGNLIYFTLCLTDNFNMTNFCSFTLKLRPLKCRGKWYRWISLNIVALIFLTFSFKCSWHKMRYSVFRKCSRPCILTFFFYFTANWMKLSLRNFSFLALLQEYKCFLY